MTTLVPEVHLDPCCSSAVETRRQHQVVESRAKAVARAMVAVPGKAGRNLSGLLASVVLDPIAHSSQDLFHIAAAAAEAGNRVAIRAVDQRRPKRPSFHHRDHKIVVVGELIA